MASSVSIFKFSISSPADTTPLDRLKEAGYDPSEILAVVGKTEGNGCVNDFSRTLAAVAWESKIPKDAITVFSGGTEGVLSPHVTFFVKSTNHTGLAAAVGHTRLLNPHEIGTSEHARLVAQEVANLVNETGASPADVRLVLIKCPLLTSSKIEAIRSQSRVPLTTDTYESMAKSRYASAVGIAAALGEIPEAHIEKALTQAGTWSTKASCSSGAELDDCHILVLAASTSPNGTTGGSLRAVSTEMTDAMDAPALLSLLEYVKRDKGHVLQVFAKAEADPSGLVRGMRHTMNTDSDIHSTRHARAAVGGLIAGLVGDSMVYVSGGAEGQGRPGGGSLCVVYRLGG